MSDYLFNNYKEIKDVFENNDNLQKEDIYQKLINKEDIILKSLTNMSNNEQQNKTNLSNKYLLTSPLHLIIKKVFQTINIVIHEISLTSEPSEIFNIILKKDRIIYLGIFCIFISFLLLLLSST